MRLVAVLALACLPAPPLVAQSVDQLVARGDSLSHRLHPDSALAWYRRAVALDSTGSRQLWKVGHALVDIAKQMPGEPKAAGAIRDSLYLTAAQYGWKAIAANNDDADAHFVVGLALGRLALTRGGRDKVRYGDFVQWEAYIALRLAPNHDGAHHVLGAFHAEVQRLSPVTRFIARTVFGAKGLAYTNWDSARVHLERAVELNPTYLFHRLDLAKALIDTRRYDEARKQLEAIGSLPPTTDVLDPAYKKEAEALLAEIRKRKK